MALPKKDRRLSETFFWLCALSLSGSWIAILVRKPHKWVGFSDGWFYQMQIKANANLHLLPREFNGDSISYPYYIFWLSGKLQYLFTITDTSTTFTILGIFASFGVFLFPYVILKKHVRIFEIFAVGLMVYLNIVFLDIIVIHKPHELIAFSISLSLTYKYILYKQLNLQLKKSEYIRDSLLLGISFGGQPIFAAISLITILYFFLKYREYRSSQIYLFISLSIIFGIGSVLPGFISTLHGGLKPGFRPGEYWIFTSLSPIFFGAFILILILFLGNKKKLEVVKIEMFLIPVIFSIFGFGLLCFLAFIGYISVLPPQRFVLGISGYVALFILAVLREKLDKLELPSYKSAGGVAFLLSMSLAYTSVLFLTGASEDLPSTFALSKARNDNALLQTVSKDLNSYSKSIMLVNGEFRFVQFYSDNSDIKLVLPFNEGWSSPSSGVKRTYQSLQSAVNTGSAETFYLWLRDNNIDTLILEGRLDQSLNYNISVNLFEPFPSFNFMTSREILLPNEFVNYLLVKGWKNMKPTCDCTWLKSFDSITT